MPINWSMVRVGFNFQRAGKNISPNEYRVKGKTFLKPPCRKETASGRSVLYDRKASPSIDRFAAKKTAIKLAAWCHQQTQCLLLRIIAWEQVGWVVKYEA